MVLLYNGVKAFAGSLIVGAFQESGVDKFRNTFSFDLFSWAETSWEYLELISPPSNDCDQQTCLRKNHSGNLGRSRRIWVFKKFPDDVPQLGTAHSLKRIGLGNGIGGQIIFSTRSKLNRFTLLVCWVGQHTLLLVKHHPTDKCNPKHLLLSR